MKRAPYELSEDLSGTRPWRSLGELKGSPEVAEALARELPEGAAMPPTSVERRSFLKLMGASLGLSGLAACRRPEETIVPYARTPEVLVPGRPLYFATSMPFDGSALGIVVESHEGRPTKVEGNPQHSESRGGTSAYAQAAILDLYDNERSKTPLERGAKRSWEDAERFLGSLRAQLLESKGKGLAILTEPHRSPTLQRGLAALMAELPNAKVFRYAAFSGANVHAGARLAYGAAADVVHDYAAAKVVIALDADILGSEGSTVRAARGLAEQRNPDREDKDLARLWCAESAFTITGASADHRIAIKSSEVARFASAIGRALVALAPGLFEESLARVLDAAPKLGDKLERAARAIAKDLVRRRGAAVLVAGRRQPAAVHALLRVLEARLGNLGKTARPHAPFSDADEGPESALALARAIESGEIDTLVVLGSNPVFDAPSDARFADAMKKVRVSVHVGAHADETAALATWHLPRAHFLESWGDVVAQGGQASIIQPLIQPLFSGRTDAEIVDRLGGGTKTAHALVLDTWRDRLGALDFDKKLARVLHDGVLASSESATLEPKIDEAAVARALASALELAPAPDGIEVSFAPDFHVFDGRFARNAWLQELPEPMTKLTWANAALVSVKLAEKLGIEDGHLLEITAGDKRIEIPAIIAPGQVDGSVALTFGQGRGGIGTDVGPLRTAGAFGFVPSASVKRVGSGRVSDARLARTQEHFLMEGRPLARRGSAEKYREEPSFVQHMVSHRPSLPLYQAERPEGHAWGMTIDLSACTGCNACVVACQAENNIPVVGPEAVARSREMHWLRIDRYFEGDPESPTSIVQPVLCQHCENAPCEQVCPVGATTHSPEGLNEMTYNRCIGTKYCGNNCPFKVRRFNWFDFRKDQPTLVEMAMNPDVTVRSRGVMEKCSFCVQRINQAKSEAKVEGRARLHDGEVVTACQSACPARAITFGDLEDKQSAVARAAKNPRAYHMLEEINVRARVSYLARIDNVSPDLEET